MKRALIPSVPLVERTLRVLLAVLDGQVQENSLDLEQARGIFLRTSRLLKLDIAEELQRLGVAEMSRRLGISRESLYRWIRLSKIPPAPKSPLDIA